MSFFLDKLRFSNILGGDIVDWTLYSTNVTALCCRIIYWPVGYKWLLSNARFCCR